MTKYEKIAKEFRKNILNKFYYPREKLPTESQLMEYYNVSRNTIRQTLSTLESEGYIYSIQGSGYYVRDAELIDSIALKSLSEKSLSDLSTNKIVENKVLSFTTVSATHFMAKLFNIPINSKLYNFERIRYVDDCAVMLENTFMPATLFPDLVSKDAEGSIFTYVEKICGYTISHSIRQYKSIIIDECNSKKLNVKYPTAATSVISTGFLKKEIPFEYSTILQIDTTFTYLSRRV